jgi:phosphomannomutase
MAGLPENLIVSVSGIRGIIGDSLRPEIATRFAVALGSEFARGRVILARDSRPSGEMLNAAVRAGLLGTGCTVVDIGIAPTPTVGIAVRQLHAAGAIQITASHNPAPWNGLKLFGADGAVLPATRGQDVLNRFLTESFSLARWNEIGSVSVPPDVSQDHLRLVLDHISPSRIASAGLSVFLDGNGGAGGPLGSALLHELGCSVVEYHCEANGEFVHEPEPTPAHLADVAPWVAHNQCHIGFVLDPDSDRLALIDEQGRCVSEELTLALAVKYRLSQDRGPVVVNMSTSRVIEDLAHAAGCSFARSAVGEANVVEMIRSQQAIIGGEGNGGVIDPRIGWVRDPFIGMGLILMLMAESRKPLSQLVAELPQYAMLKTKATLDRHRLHAGYDRLRAHWPQAKVNTVDGLRLDGPDWWLHVRGSNTEPIVRIIAESPNLVHTESLCQQSAEILTQA